MCLVDLPLQKSTYPKEIILFCFVHYSTATNATIRVYLVNGPNKYEGRVVLTYNGVNGTICDDSFGVRGVRVLCRMLGFR